MGLFKWLRERKLEMYGKEFALKAAFVHQLVTKRDYENKNSELINLLKAQNYRIGILESRLKTLEICALNTEEYK
jgi:hypothetical protein